MNPRTAPARTLPRFSSPCWCLASFARTWAGPARSDRHRRWDLLFALAWPPPSTAELLHVPRVLPPVFLFLAYRREFRRAPFSGGMVAAFTAVLVLPWAIRALRQGGTDYLNVVFVDNTVGRFFHLGHHA